MRNEDAQELHRRNREELYIAFQHPVNREDFEKAEMEKVRMYEECRSQKVQIITDMQTPNQISKGTEQSDAQEAGFHTGSDDSRRQDHRSGTLPNFPLSNLRELTSYEAESGDAGKELRSRVSTSYQSTNPDAKSAGYPGPRTSTDDVFSCKQPGCTAAPFESLFSFQ